MPAEKHIRCRHRQTHIKHLNTHHTTHTAPWLTKLANAFLSGKIVERQAALAADAVDNLTQLGPTFVKLGQILSIR